MFHFSHNEATSTCEQMLLITGSGNQVNVASPQTKAAELKDRLSALAFDSGPLNEFALASIKREAEALKKTDPVAAYSILGGLASLLFDDEGVDRNHKAAIALNNTATTHYDYAVSLQFVHRRDDAADEALLAAKMDPLDLPFSRMVVRFLAISGRLKEAYEVYEQLRNKFPSADLQENAELPQVMAILGKWGIEEAHIQTCQRQAFGFLRERKIKGIGVSLDTTSILDDEMIMYSILLDLPREEVRRLDEELTDHIWEVSQFPGSKQFWIGLEQFRDHGNHTS
jgi:hypothetical protein